MKVLVTGGAGFIGSHVADAFLDLGHTVHILDNLSTGKEKNINPRASFTRGDIRDADLVERLLHEGRFDALCHHAAQIDVRSSVADPVTEERRSEGALRLERRCDLWRAGLFSCG
jgi:UDP-glucose 4-epimerase